MSILDIITGKAELEAIASCGRRDGYTGGYLTHQPSWSRRCRRAYTAGYWQGTAAGHAEERRGARAALRGVPLSPAASERFAAGWRAVAARAYLACQSGE